MGADRALYAGSGSGLFAPYIAGHPRPANCRNEEYTVNDTYHFETIQLHAGQEHPDPATGARAVPIYQSASFVFENCRQAAARFDLSEPGNIYGRLTGPTQEVFERRMAALEQGAGALALSSGAAAVTYALQGLAACGDHIVAANTLYGGSYNLLAHTLPAYGITTTFVDPHLPENFERAITPRTKAVFLESLGNPNCSLIDIRAVAAIAHRHGIPLVVDNTFATPYLFRPIEHGADIVVHSATKFIGGHGTAIGGVIVDSGKFDWSASGRFPALTQPDPSYHGVCFAKAAGPAAYIARLRAVLLRDTGATLSPFHAFLFLQGLETLSLRVERHVQNATRVAQFLQRRPEIARVNYPSLPSSPYFPLAQRDFPRGTGSIFTVELAGGETAAKRFIDHLQLFSLLANVADVKSLIIHPASTTHAQMTGEELLGCGITPGTVRLSVGTEHIDDLLADISQSLAEL